MYFFQQADSGNWILGQNLHDTVPAGTCSLLTGANSANIKIKTVEAGNVLANGMSATDFKKADGSYYETFNEFYDVVWAFFISTTNNLYASTFRGVVDGGVEIASGDVSGLLTYTPAMEGITVLKWQYSVAPFDTWVDIAETSGAPAYVSGALTKETMFRVVGQYGDLIFPSTYTTTTIALPLAPDGITGDETVAPASEQVYSVTTPAGDALSYVWTVPTNWVITDGQGTDEITVTTGGVSDDGDVSVYAVNATGVSDAVDLAILIDAVPAQPSIITGTTPQIHETAGEKYSVTNVVGVTYAWTVPTGWTITAGDTTNEITVTTGAYGKNGNITVTATNDYGTSVARTLAVTIGAAPAQPAAITGDATQLSGATGQNYYIDTVAGATSYTWTFPVGWTVTDDSTINERTVTIGDNTTSGNVTVKAVSIYGESTARTLAVLVADAPDQPSVITGLETQEPAAVGQVYSVVNVAGMTYNWTLPANWVKTAGGTTNEITVTVGGVDDDGDISVTATDAYGTSIARTLTVAVVLGE